MTLGLYLLERKVVLGPGGSCYSGDREAMLVAAPSEERARKLAEVADGDPCWSSSIPPNSASCTRIGQAEEGVQEGVLLDAFDGNHW